MFIRMVYKRNKPCSTKYEYQQLVESIRTEKGVSQKLLLSLGRLPIPPKNRWPSLARRIQSIIQGQESLIKPEPEIEKLAQKFARQFVTVLAYHLLHSIRTALRQSGVKMSWRRIRGRMATHCRVTNRIKNKQGDILFIRKCTEPEDFQKMIYDALRIDHVRCKTKRYKLKICNDP